ncbi:MAG: efflux RND transporter periplasmic adaptor subunit [Lachnospiraceae bacterium]|nr:efflux RND transporter periplasmic adaptor subunit [Lachnospiraceae bacterium]
MKVFKKCLIISGGMAALCGSYFILTAFAGKATAYETGQVSVQGISETVEVTGDVHGEDSTTYYSAVTAPVSYFDLKVGDLVESGHKVLSYDLKDLILARDQAELTAESAENNMNGQVKQSNSNQAKYSKAKADAEAYQVYYALVRQDSDAINQSQYQENWDINCAADGIQQDIAKKTGEISNYTLDLEKAKAAGDEKEVKRLTHEIEHLNTDIANLNADLAGLPPASLSPEEYARQVADGNWMSDIMRNWNEASTLRNTYEGQILNSYQKDQLQNSYDLTLLSVESAEDNLAIASDGVKVTGNGIVTECFVGEGSVVTRGTPLFTVESSDRMKVDTGVSKYDIGKIREGQRAQIVIAGNTYTGKVTQISRMAQAQNSDKAKVTVSVSFDAPDELVYIGLEADVTIYTTEKNGVLTIPVEALYADDDGTYCYVIRNGVVEKQYIHTGVESDTSVEVFMGLNEGETVITEAITDDQVGSRAEAK